MPAAYAAPYTPPAQPATPSPARGGSAQRGRPDARVFSFGAPIADASAPAEDPDNTCPNCESPNPPGYRYCVTCGATIGRAAHSPEPEHGESSAPGDMTPVIPGPAGMPRGLGANGAREPEDKIVGSPVVEIAGAHAAPAKLITCPRCRGQSVAGTRFCRYCGAPLGDIGGDPSAAETPGMALGQAPEPAPWSEDAVTPPPRPYGAPFPRDPSGAAHDAQPISTSSRPYEPAERSFAAAAEPPPAAFPAEPARGAIDRAFAGPAAGGGASPMTAGAPVQAGAARLVSITEDGSEGKSYALGEAQIDIGRTEGDIVLYDDPYVSPRHARLSFEGGRWIVRDLFSTNRIYLRIKKAYPLRDGDLLLLGLEVLQFQVVSDAERGLGHATQHGTLLFGSPATPRRARLCQKTVEGVIRDVYHLYKDETVIGRETADIVFSSDPFLSRRHAMIRRSPSTNDFSVADLDSSNGTYVAIRGDTPLANGDFVRIGQHLFRMDLA